MGKYYFDNVKYITNLKNEEYDPNNIEYIVSCDDMRVKINDVCNRLKHPVTIININYDPACCKDGRLDPDASYYTIRPTCRNFRIAAGESYCMECDEYYARYCKELIEGDTYSTEPLDFFAECCKRNLPKLKYDNDRDINYLVYDCPLLGYCEMCFPIYFHNRIIGFLVVGELLLKDKQKIKQEIINDFFMKQSKSQDNIFSSYIEKWKKKHPYKRFNFDCMKKDAVSLDQTLENLNNIDILVREDYKHLLEEEELKNLISKCCDESKNLELFLKEKWKEKVKQHYKRILKTVVGKFNTKSSNIRARNEITYIDVQEMFNSIWEAIVELKEEFSFQYCRLYDNLSNISNENTVYNLDKIGASPFDQQNMIFDFTKITLSMTQCRSSLDDCAKNNPLSCFISDGGISIDRDCNIALACENLAVLFGVDKYSLFIKNEEYECLVILFKEISRLFLHMSANLDRIFSLFLQQQHEKTLHMYRHECAHLAQRIQQNNKYYSNRDRYERLSTEKKENIYRDIKSTSLMLQHLSTNIGILLGSVNAKTLRTRYKPIDVRDEINKWRAMFRLELRKKNLRIFNNTAPIDTNLHFNTHEELFGILLYNLIDNAVKYSYWGTNIFVEITPDQIIIRNYGIKIELGSKPYDLYYRDKKNVQNSLGDGIGLYSSKKAAKILGLELSHTCEKISNYNIPFVNVVAKNKVTLDKKDVNFEQAIRELNQAYRRDILTPEDYYGDGYPNIETSVVQRDISKPTYCVTFIVKGLEI